MNLIIVENDQEIGEKAADIFVATLLMKRNSILGLATGSTPLSLYRELIERHKNGKIDFKDAISFNLDEYIGLKEDDPQSYHYFMQENLFKHINLASYNHFIPDGNTPDPDSYGKKYDEKIKSLGGIDLQVLGIGTNGHIGFNEPSDVFTYRTRRVQLTQSTIEANARFFQHIADVPTEALSMGLGTIMKAKRILLLASGKAKAQAIKKAVLDDPAPNCPASILQFHQNTTVILDKDAASLLDS